MQHFIPFEDDWDALGVLSPQDLVPFRLDLLEPSPDQHAESAAPMLPPPGTSL